MNGIGVNVGERVLVTGANGFVGQVLCRRLLALGFKVSWGVRDRYAQRKVPFGSEFVITGDIDGETEWRLKGVAGVIHLAARVHVMKDQSLDPLAEFRKVNVEGAAVLAKSAAESGVRRFIMVSSVKVNGESTHGRPFCEQDAPNPLDPYGISKWEAEEKLREISLATGMEAVVVRPPVVYGPNVRGNILRLFAAVEKGIPLPLAGVKNSRSMIYVDNLADALITLLSHPDAAGETFLVSDGEDISTPQLLRELAALMGKKSRLFPCPERLLALLALLAGKSAEMERLLGSLQVESGKIRRLGWRPPYSLHQGLRATAEWYLSTLPRS